MASCCSDWLGLHAALVRGVVGLDDQKVGSRQYGVADPPVVGDLVADHIAEPHRARDQRRLRGPGGEVPGDELQRAEPAEERPCRDVLAERDELAFGVRSDRSLLRQPQLSRVVRLVARPVQDGADQQRTVQLPHGIRHQGAQLQVSLGIAVQGVLGPQHHVGTGNLTSADGVGQLLGLSGMVLCHPSDTRLLGQRALAFDIALHDGHHRAPPRRLRGRDQQRCDHQCDHTARRDRTRPPVTAPPGRHAVHQQRSQQCRDEGERGGATDRGPLAPRRVRLAEGEPAPRETAEWGTPPKRLDRDPPGSGEQRPSPQREQPRQEHRGEGHEQGLDRGQREPRQHAEIGEPDDQRTEEGRSEDCAGRECRPAGPAPDRDDQ